MRQDNIILFGMPASGKSTIGALVSKKLNIPFFDLDDIIEKKENRKISQIFKEDGEKYFRELEVKTIKTFDFPPHFVLSTGGGTVERLENVELLKALGLTFYIDIQTDLIFERIKDDKTRPLLQKKDPKMALKEIYDRRKEKYELAEFKIPANGAPDDIAKQIVDIYAKTNS